MEEFQFPATEWKGILAFLCGFGLLIFLTLAGFALVVYANLL